MSSVAVASSRWLGASGRKAAIDSALARSISARSGAKASWHGATWSGWMRLFPLNPSARPSRAWASNPSLSFNPLNTPSKAGTPAARAAIDPDGAFEVIRAKVLAYVQTELIAREMNAFDAALALIALGWVYRRFVVGPGGAAGGPALPLTPPPPVPAPPG